MERLSVAQMIARIENGKCFEAVSDDYSFTLKIDSYSHYVCGAVHDGHKFRKELWDLCTHSDYERWYEDDPATKEMVKSHPIVIASLDSRFEYDLNRAPEVAVYEDAWGRALWKKPLSEEMKAKSLAKHHSFYQVVHALIAKIENLHDFCVVYDMHSYNWQRWDREVPTWNLGTSNIDNLRFQEDIEAWRTSLSEMVLPHEIKSSAAINDTFFGNGYFLKFISSNFKNTLVLATEVAKIYCDETSMALFPEVIRAIEEELRVRIPNHAESFLKRRHTN